jgi:hypothetical protein
MPTQSKQTGSGVEGNRLIAEFLGWTFEIKPDDFGGELIAYFDGKIRWRGEKPEYLNKIMETGFLFHSDWNKLMAVVEKIGAMIIKYNLTSKCVIFRVTESDENDIIVKHDNNLIEAVWQAVIQFIKWYNTTQPIK